jgi:hypothetical protein
MSLLISHCLALPDPAFSWHAEEPLLCSSFRPNLTVTQGARRHRPSEMSSRAGSEGSRFEARFLAAARNDSCGSSGIARLLSTQPPPQFCFIPIGLPPIAPSWLAIASRGQWQEWLGQRTTDNGQRTVAASALVASSVTAGSGSVALINFPLLIPRIAARLCVRRIGPRPEASRRWPRCVRSAEPRCSQENPLSHSVPSLSIVFLGTR